MRFVPSEHEIWETELRLPLDSMPLMERADVAALRYLLDNPSHKSFEREVSAMRASKQRYSSMHLERRRALAERFKTLLDVDPSMNITQVEKTLIENSFPVGWILSDMSVAILGRRLPAGMFDAQPRRHPSLWAWGTLTWLTMFANVLMGSGLPVPRRYRLQENDMFDNVIASLAPYSRVFVCDDQGARERCQLLHDANLVPCEVMDGEKLLSERSI